MLGALVTLGCASAPEPTAPRRAGAATVTSTSQAPERRFAFRTLDGAALASAALRGRMTVLALVATFDDPSQAQARFVQMVYRRHQPRINAVLLVLDPPENRPMVFAFRDALGISFPVVLADAATRAGTGPLPGLHHVPAVVILDRHGRERWRRLGVVGARELDAVIDDLDEQ